MSPIGNSLTKLTRVHNYKSSPIQRHQNRFCTPTPSWRNQVHNVWRSKAEQTDRPKNSTFLATPAAGEIRALPNWHGDRGPRARSCTCKTFGVWRIVSLLGGAENLRITRPHQLKTSITPQPLEQIYSLDLFKGLWSCGVLYVRDCAPDFAMKALQYRNDFDAVR